MAKSINKSTFLGNLGEDPVVKYFPSGDAFVQFRIATSFDVKDKTTGLKKEYTEWHNIVANGRIAEILGEYLRKGSKVYIEARHRTRDYVDGSGVKRYFSEFVVTDFTFLGGPQERDQETKSHSGTNTQSAQQTATSNQSTESQASNQDVEQEYLASLPVPVSDHFDDDLPY